MVEPTEVLIALASCSSLVCPRRSRPQDTTRRERGQVSDVAGVAIARYDEDPTGVYLFYCDQSWDVITDTRHENLASAVEQANFEFGLLRFEAV